MLDKSIHLCGVLICLILISNTFSDISGQQFQIPIWIKNTAGWWYEGKITDSDFTKGIEYLIQHQILIISSNNSKINKENKIPSWVKNNAGWWANGKISDNDFVLSIQYLINAGIIQINSNLNSTEVSSTTQCDKFNTPAEKETCLQDIEYNTKVKDAIAVSSPHVVGPVTFYYIKSESQIADNKTILTTHFVVLNNSDQEVTMSCLKADSCNYALSDGEKEIQPVTNTLVYGSLTLLPKTPKFVDWTFYSTFDNSKGYLFLIKESWGSGSIPIKLTNS